MGGFVDTGMVILKINCSFFVKSNYFFLVKLFNITIQLIQLLNQRILLKRPLSDLKIPL
jgi:hypothetical protein